MKNLFKAILLTCSTLSGLQADATETGATEVKLEGMFDFQSGFRNQNRLASDEKTITKYNKSLGLYTEAAISASVRHQVNEIVYGAKLVIMPSAKISTSSSYTGSHIFLESEYGKIELGTPYDADSKMRIVGDDVAAGSGNWSAYAVLDSKYMKYTDVTNYQNNEAAPDFGDGRYFIDGIHKMKIGQINEKTEPSRKVSYFTPVMKGFQLGVSYIPDSSNTGIRDHNEVSAGISKIKVPDPNNPAQQQTISLDQNVKNAFSWGASYTHNIAENTDFSVAVTGEFGQSAGKMQVLDAQGKVINTQNNTPMEYKLSNLRTYNFGVTLTCGRFAYAASYGILGKSLTTPEYHKVGRNTKYYNGGVAYTYGPVKTSVSYFKSNQFTNTLDTVSVGTEYKITPGLLPYVEVTYFQAKGRPVYYPNLPKRKVAGKVAIVGAKLKF